LKKNVLSLLSVLLILANTVLADDKICHDFEGNSVAPSNSIAQAALLGKDESSFRKVVMDVANLYKETVKQLGAELTVVNDWTDPTVNAFALKKEKDWSVHFFGGLYRQAVVTDDAMALVVCHEIGHLVGGAPFYYPRESSVEGQADFWATSVCAKKYFSEHRKEVLIDEGSPAKIQCDKQYSGAEERNICYRTAAAARALSTVFAHDYTTILSYSPTTTDKLNYTYENHPAAQCRMATYIAGSLCEVDLQGTAFEEKLLKDKKTSDFLCNDVIDGANVKTEKRPTCWFNETTHLLYGEYKKTIKSKSIFGFKEGLIQVAYLSHLEGDVKVKLIPDTDSAQYVQVQEDEFKTHFAVGSSLKNYDFHYKFVKKANKEIRFRLLIDFNGKTVVNESFGVRAYSNI
jgi:hypothetical protein